MNRFFINGARGDIVYCLYTIMKAGGGIFDIKEHQLGEDGSCVWNREAAESVVDLLKYQSYITEVNIVKDISEGSFNFDRSRKVDRHLDHFECPVEFWPGTANLKKRYFLDYFLYKRCMRMGEALSMFRHDDKWINAPKTKNYDVIVHAPSHKFCHSPPYWQELLSFFVDCRYKVAVIDSGGPEKLQGGTWDMIKPVNLLESADYINSAKLFIGTASCNYVIAEALDKFRLVEVFSPAAGTIPRSERGWDFTGWQIEQTKRVGLRILEG